MSEVTIERLERGLSLLAYMMELDGPVYAAHYEKLERELDALRRREDTVARAKRRLHGHTDQKPALAIAAPPLAVAPPIDGDDAVFTAPAPRPNQA
jgi:hypothetical protein